MDALTLDVEGFGPAKFPVTPAKARKLITLGKPARFGRGEATLTDPDRAARKPRASLLTNTWLRTAPQHKNPVDPAPPGHMV